MLANNIYNINTPVYDNVLSKIIGERESRFLLLVLYWLNKCGQKNQYDRTFWVYNTYKQWDEQWGGPNVRTIQRVVARLRDLGLIETKQHKRKKGYCVNFYRVNFAKLSTILKEGKCRSYAWFREFKDRFFNCLKTQTTKWHDKQRLTSSNEDISIYNEREIVDKYLDPPQAPPPDKPSAVIPEKKVEISKQTSKRVRFLLGNMKARGAIPEHILAKQVDVLAQEVEFHISHFRKFKMRNIDHALNSACKLIREGKWKTPYGFTFGHEELSARRKREDLEEIRSAWLSNDGSERCSQGGPISFAKLIGFIGAMKK